MYEGEIVDVVDPDRVTEEELGLLMAGQSPENAPSIADVVGGER
jgi:simple sugar transport system ATP-binding protein